MSVATLTSPITESAGASMLLTPCEARVSFIRSAVACLRGARCGPDGILAMLRGLPSGDGWDSQDELLAVAHRRVLKEVIEAGLAWVVEQQLEGIVSATGLDEGGLRNVDVVASQLPSEDNYDPHEIG